jgi:hypothetical protein
VYGVSLTGTCAGGDCSALSVAPSCAFSVQAASVATSSIDEFQIRTVGMYFPSWIFWAAENDSDGASRKQVKRVS